MLRLRQARNLGSRLSQLQGAATCARDVCLLPHQAAGSAAAVGAVAAPTPPAAAALATRAPACAMQRPADLTLRQLHQLSLREGWAPARGLSTSAAVQQGGTPNGAGGDGGKGARKPPLVDVDNIDQEADSDGDELEAAEGIQAAFDQLISAAYELLAEGKPMEAEYLLAEGAKQAEEVLGEDALELAPLWDQLSIMLFLHEREEEALHAARKALQILEKHDEPNGPASAIAGVRYAACLLGMGEAAEAQLVLAKSTTALEQALAFMRGVETQGEEEAEEVEEAISKFETGLGEAIVYRCLARLAQAGANPAAVAGQEEELKQGLGLMKMNLGEEHPLVGAALREHNRLVNLAIENKQNEFAEALYKQEVRLHSAYSPDSEHQAMLQYQLATLQYVMGKYAEAQASIETALATLRTFELPSAAGKQQGGGKEEEEGVDEVEGQLLSVKQRLGVILGAAGKHEEARELLLQVAPDIVQKVGPSNPLTHELNVILSLAALRELGPDAPADRREQLLQEMEVNIGELGVYGDDHMLVQKAKVLFEEVAGRPPAPGPILEGAKDLA